MTLPAGLGDTETLRVEEIDDGIVLVTLDRPERMNAITTALISDLDDVVRAVDLDRTTRAVILTGSGRGFCAGADLMGTGDPAPGAEGTSGLVGSFMWQDHLATLHEHIHRSRKPWIAAINGAAVGGGFAMSLACDIRIAAESARFGAVFIKVGVSNCDMGTSYFLPRLVGASRSAELLLTGRIFDAAEASEMGLVIDVVAGEDLIERALLTARQVRENSPLAVWMTKETMWQTLDSPSLRSALDIENRTQIMITTTGAMAEAAKAFGEKRPPQWEEL